MLSALGTKKERLEHLSNATYQCTKKEMTTVLGDKLTFNYYSIDDRERNITIELPLDYLDEVVQKAIDKLQLTPADLNRCGLFLGSASIDLSLSLPLGENYDTSDEKVMACERVGNGYYADYLTKKFGLSDFSLTYNTACTSSANAVVDAASMLEGGVIDYALVIGFELFSPISFEGFIAMQLLSPEVLAPFDKNRSGIVLGEAVSALFMSRDDVRASHWIYRGGSSRCETHSVTGANSDGTGIASVIEAALDEANILAGDIQALKAHGTSSALNDLAEINAMKQVFTSAPNFFSLKPYIGHTLGSCGSSELLLLLECVDDGFIPKTPGFSTVDTDLSWSPTTKKIRVDNGHFMLNYFGFGGNNTSLIIEKVPS